jgi:hypothetical protein
MPSVVSLLAERATYLRRNLPARVKQVEEQLRLLGFAVEETASVDPREETATTKKTRKKV